MKRIDTFKYLIPREGDMKVDAMIFSSERLIMEKEAVRQLQNAASIPGVSKALATPDIHVGYGVPIGCVLAMENEVIPSAVGYDINCGMRLMTTPFSDGEIDIKKVADSIRRDVPLGEGRKNIKLNKSDLKNVLKNGVKSMTDWAKQYPRLEEAWNDDEFENDLEKIEENGSMQGDSSSVSFRAMDRGKDQIGTLGGGNHFIEIQKVKSIADERTASSLGLKKDQIVIMIHSGSRALGHQVGGDYMKPAAAESRGKSPDRSLGFFAADSENGRRYIGAMRAAANFAFVNREVMALLVRRNFKHYFGDIALPLIYDIAHNMVKKEVHNGKSLWVHRKGATRAFPKSLMRNTCYQHLGQPVIIPGSMGTASYLLLGTESGRESLYSVNHGAGRTMSRSQARGKVRRKTGKVIKPAAISDKRFEESMKGIYLLCENRRSIKEEAPDAYKDIDEVIRVVTGAGLATLAAKMIPLAVLKG